jgi:hypothetical protein
MISNNLRRFQKRLLDLQAGLLKTPFLVVR